MHCLFGFAVDLVTQMIAEGSKQRIDLAYVACLIAFNSVLCLTVSFSCTHEQDLYPNLYHVYP